MISYARRVIGVASMEDGMMISYHFMSGNEDKKEINYFKRAIELLR